MMSFGDTSRRAWTLDERAAEPIVRRAIERRITFFDTADVYAGGASELVTGRLLRKLILRDEAVVATKVFYPTTDGPNGAGLSRKHILAAIDASLQRLQMDYVDLYQIHRADPKTPIEETMEALHDVVRSGKARYLGASTMPAWRFAKAQAVAERHGWKRFVSMQNHYNLLYREEEREMIPLCRDQGVALLPYSPLARGLLAKPRETVASTARAGFRPPPHQPVRSGRRRGSHRLPPATRRGTRHVTRAGRTFLAHPPSGCYRAGNRGDGGLAHRLGSRRMRARPRRRGSFPPTERLSATRP
jgi:1-deoxyxylulose-5-phosphate synthase